MNGIWVDRVDESETSFLFYDEKKVLPVLKSVLPDPEGPETVMNRRSFDEIILFFNLTLKLVTSTQLYWTVSKGKWQSRHK